MRTMWIRSRFGSKAMIDGMDEVLNAPGTEGSHVPVEVESEVGRTWVS
jgi:hypothetical protein